MNFIIVTPEEAMRDALSQHLDCGFASWSNSTNWRFQPTILVLLWRNEECCQAGDPPRHIVDGYLRA